MEGAPKYTPEEKAKMQQSRTLSDAEFIGKGSSFVPGHDGEPILEVPLKLQRSLEVLRQEPESQKLLKIIEKTGPVHGNSAMMGRSIRYPVESLKGLSHRGISIYMKRRELPPGMKEKDPFAMGIEYNVRVALNDDKNGLPYISINKVTSVINSHIPEEISSKKCYSLKEYYDNLAPEEKEKGEALGKELESYLEEKG